jgi:hypothetical protein
VLVHDLLTALVLRGMAGENESSCVETDGTCGAAVMSCTPRCTQLA